MNLQYLRHRNRSERVDWVPLAIVGGIFAVQAIFIGSCLYIAWHFVSKLW